MKFNFLISTLLCLAQGKVKESVQFDASEGNKESDLTPDGDGLHPYANGMNPGMAMRLEEQTVFALQRALQEFLPHYIEYDWDKPDEYKYTFTALWGHISIPVRWSQITYSEMDEAKLDVSDIKIFFLNQDHEQRLKFSFPMLKEYKIKAWQHVNLKLFQLQEGFVTYEFKDFKFSFLCELKTTSQGYLRPIVYSTTLDFGESYLYHDNNFIAFFMKNIIDFTMVCMENSVQYFGTYIDTELLGPVISYATNDFQYLVPVQDSPFPGQTAQAEFAFDYRQTRDPFMGNGFLDTYFLGDMYWTGNNEKCILEPTEMQFRERVRGEQISQLVISDSAVTCWAENFARSPYGQLSFNKTQLNQFFNVTNMNLDTTAYKKYIPLFYEKLGPNKPLRVELSFKDINIKFNEYSVDVEMEFTLCMAYYLDTASKQNKITKGPNESNDAFERRENKIQKPLIYDELKMLSEVEMGELKQDVLHPKIKKLQLLLTGHGNQRNQPHDNNMKMTKNDYQEFLTSFGMSTNQFKKYMNDVYLRDGIHTPWTLKEIETTMAFSDRAVHIFFEVYREAAKFLEDEFWDPEDTKY